MRSTQRDKLLILLAITSGSADGWSFVGLGNAFVANMTGNTVLLGLSVAGAHGFLHPLIAIVSYVFGVAIGTTLTRKVSKESVWDVAVSRVLLLETFFLTATTAGWMVFKGFPPSRWKEFLLAGLATALGLQSGGMLSLQLPGIVTTYITGTWTTLVSGVTLVGEPEQRRLPQDTSSFQERLITQIFFLAAYFSAAIATGYTLGHLRWLIGAICIVPCLTVAIYGLVAERNPGN